MDCVVIQTKPTETQQQAHVSGGYPWDYSQVCGSLWAHLDNRFLAEKCQVFIS